MCIAIQKKCWHKCFVNVLNKENILSRNCAALVNIKASNFSKIQKSDCTQMSIWSTLKQEIKRCISFWAWIRLNSFFCKEIQWNRQILHFSRLRFIKIQLTWNSSHPQAFYTLQKVIARSWDFATEACWQVSNTLCVGLSFTPFVENIEMVKYFA